MRRYPYHRYLTYRVLNGDTIADIIEHMVDLEYIPPLEDDVAELQQHLLRRRVTHEVRERERVLFFDDEDMDTINWIVETTVARTCAERLLLDRVHPKHVATVLGLKFGCDVTAKAIDLFRDGFWDTSTLRATDFGEYFALGGGSKPKPPPTSLTTRAAYSMWKQGLVPDEESLGPDTIVREIQVDAFMRFKETRDRHDHKRAIDWAKLALKTTPTHQALINKANKIPEVVPILETPERYVPTLGELHSEYSERQSGTGATSEAAGRREDDGDPRA